MTPLNEMELSIQPEEGQIVLDLRFSSTMENCFQKKKKRLFIVNSARAGEKWPCWEATNNLKMLWKGLAASGLQLHWHHYTT